MTQQPLPDCGTDTASALALALVRQNVATPEFWTLARKYATAPAGAARSAAEEAMTEYVASAIAPVMEREQELLGALDRLCTHEKRTSAQINADWDHARDVSDRVKAATPTRSIAVPMTAVSATMHAGVPAAASDSDAQDAALWRYTQQKGYFSVGQAGGGRLDVAVGVQERGQSVNEAIQGRGATLKEAIEKALAHTQADLAPGATKGHRP